jgi:hypothetical protein
VVMDGVSDLHQDHYHTSGSDPTDAGAALPASQNRDDQDWNIVLDALKDDRFKLRTAEGISSETALSIQRVKKLLTHHSDMVRTSYVLDKKGRELYAPKGRPITRIEVWATIRAFITHEL